MNTYPIEININIQRVEDLRIKLNGKEYALIPIVDNDEEEHRPDDAPTLAEGAAKPSAIGDVYHWTVTYNETATAIETVKTAEETSLENAVIYNLNGQRVEKAQKGINIVNGKKVIIK
jgi:hypothetical protein